MTTGSADVPLTAFQLEVAQLFFSLPASDGFVLAGGAALLAQHLTVRPTQDLDFFTDRQAGIVAAREALIARPVSGAGACGRYPNDHRTRDQADSAVWGMWGAHRSLLIHEDENYFTNAIKWAKTFLGTNSMTSRCIRSREIKAEEHDDEGRPVESSTDTVSDGEMLAPSVTPEDGAHLRRLAMDLLSSYEEALETSPARLHDREQQEVHSGLVARVGRDVITALGVPDLWCMEHGAHIVRTLVEVRVYVQWMAQQDPSIYRAFQEYGAGKAKLYARIMSELPEGARRRGFKEAINDLERLSHNDEVLDHRVVDTRDSFADGKSIRTMADECGLLDLYRQAYYMASGVAHSEWWSIETHAMERCMNVLHGGHLVPSLSLNSGGNVEFA